MKITTTILFCGKEVETLRSVFDGLSEAIYWYSDWYSDDSGEIFKKKNLRRVEKSKKGTKEKKGKEASPRTAPGGPQGEFQ